jgi:hypothetical protein
MTSDEDDHAPAPLTAEEKLWAFRKATNSMEGAGKRWSERVVKGLTDEQLEEAIAYELGAFGSHGGDPVGVTYQGSGLKIWADRCLGCRRNEPILQGKETVRLARDVYGIRDPNDKQGRLF